MLKKRTDNLGRLLGQRSKTNAETRMNTGFRAIANQGLHPFCTF